MIATRPDWCISRQRDWGVPIAALFCEACGAAHATRALCEHVAGDLRARGRRRLVHAPGRGAGAAGHALRALRRRRRSGARPTSSTSGSTRASAGAPWSSSGAELGGRADIYLEGSDQHRGWFHSSLLTARRRRGARALRRVLTHGFVARRQRAEDVEVARQRRSRPTTIIKRHGAELLRLWVAAEDYRERRPRSRRRSSDSCVEAYRRIRNTARFLLGNLVRLRSRARRGAARDAARARSLGARTARTRSLARVRAAYEAYEFHVVYHALNNFCAVDLSALYLDVRKDRLYCERADGPRAARARRRRCTPCSTRWSGSMAPVLSFTADEVWSFLPGATEPTACSWPASASRPATWCDDALAARFERLLAVRAAVTKAIEEARQAGVVKQGSEARVTLARRGRRAGRAARRAARTICRRCSSSPRSARRRRCGEPAGARAPRRRSNVRRGEKCERCWTSRGRSACDPRHPTLCERCAAVVAMS